MGNEKKGICRATRADGSPCRGRAGPSGLCFAHDDALRDQRRVGNAQGGYNRRNEARAMKMAPEVMRPVMTRLLRAMQQVGEGQMEPRVGTALAALAGAIVRTYEVGMLEERVTALEQGNEQQVG